MQRLWLAGDARQRPGVIGAARCARLEPLGDCIRFVMDLGGGVGEPDLDAGAMVAAAARLDLVSNVFQGGKHGSLVMLPINVRAPPVLQLQGSCPEAVSHAESGMLTCCEVSC
jgi:hypothetical protein